MARYFKVAQSPYLVPFDGKFRIKDAKTRPPKDAPDKEACKLQLKERVAQLEELQHLMYAHDKHSLLLIFQAMDASGKDSTIRAVFSGVNPTGCHITSYKRPSLTELDHDFLWRSTMALPERGRIGVHNRSYYEEVLAVRVHPQFLESQKLPHVPKNLDELWQERYDSIREYEKHLARNGTVVVKFWLNVSRDEQRDRFLARLEEPEKNWKFESGDIKERGFWQDYMKAYEDALGETSRPWAPWYAIPADGKPFMRLCVAEIIVKTLKHLDMHFPELEDSEKAQFAQMKKLLLKGK